MEQELHSASDICDEGTNDTSATAETACEGTPISTAEQPDTEIGEAEEAEAETTECEEEDFSRQAEEDLSVLRRQFPSLFAEGLTALRDPGRYGELREAGLSPVEAFCASHTELFLGMVPRSNNRAHLGSCVPRGASLASGQLGARELEEARELFPSLSDGEIETLYRRVEKTRRH